MRLSGGLSEGFKMHKLCPFSFLKSNGAAIKKKELFQALDLTVL